MITADNPDRWLTARRLRAHGTIVALCLWSLYMWTLATPGLRDRNGNLKGTDFLHFYTIGSLAAEHRGSDLYDMRGQAALAAERVPQAAGIRYLPLYPPQVSLLFAPLARLSYGWALASWWIFSAALYGTCCFFVTRECSNLRRHGATIAVLALAFPAFFNLIAWGQTSALALACFTAMFFFLRSRRQLLAGIALGCLIFKPQLGIAAAVVLIAAGAWRVVLGATISAAAELSSGVLYYGVEPLRQWLRLLRHSDALWPLLEPRPYQTHSLRTFWTMLVPCSGLAAGLYAVCAVAVLAATIAIWRRSNSALAVRFAALLFATVLLAPHLTVYDLVILAPAILLLADWAVADQSNGSGQVRGLGTLLYLVYALPLLGPLSRWTHLQLSVIAMSATVFVLWRAVTRQEAEPGARFPQSR